jgi:cytochrome c peroxidase
MKIVTSLAICLLGASSLFGTTLVEKAKNSGLEAIPADKTKLMKMIDDKNDPITKEKVELGKKLYFDPRLSRSGLISCNTCHNLALC